MGEIVKFNFGQAEVTKSEMQRGGAWWVASEICGILGLSNPTVTVAALDKDERSKFYLVRQGDGWIISEPGLYRLIMRSRKLEATDEKGIPGLWQKRFAMCWRSAKADRR